jgi:hypothetical protein
VKIQKWFCLPLFDRESTQQQQQRCGRGWCTWYRLYVYGSYAVVVAVVVDVDSDLVLTRSAFLVPKSSHTNVAIQLLRACYRERRSIANSITGYYEIVLTIITVCNAISRDVAVQCVWTSHRHRHRSLHLPSPVLLPPWRLLCLRGLQVQHLQHLQWRVPQSLRLQ